ncbi:hypothetical protein PYR71_13390 [Rhizobium sp. MC63]|uniref:Uncharacterized protein n=1 Tax=Rhizobium mulingense TaxID=3031128 RepID=A0ACC6MYB1_9HYPH|nr:MULTISPECIES: hypothetical protein [unclassified Rhizobium]MDF0697481.1 hypothetical protein [Rhizobium sp. MC63]MEA3518329.1 hypothetical protein [Rhizobium sp. MJ31]
MNTAFDESYIYYRIGDDGEWEQCRTTELPPHRAACQAVDMIADALERTKDMSPAEREIELERVLELVDQVSASV